MTPTTTTSDSPASSDRRRWFAEEVQPHESLLKAYLRKACPSAHDVEDVVQEAYLRI